MLSEVTLRLTMADLSVLDKALGGLLYREAAPLVAKINAQINAQTRDKQQAPEVPTNEPGR